MKYKWLHYTKKKNLRSIYKKGLIPGFRPGIPCGGRRFAFEPDKALYFVREDTPLDYFDTGWEKEFAIIEVDISGYKLYPDYYSLADLVDYELWDHVATGGRPSVLWTIRKTKTVKIADSIPVERLGSYTIHEAAP